MESTQDYIAELMNVNWNINHKWYSLSYLPWQAFLRITLKGHGWYAEMVQDVGIERSGHRYSHAEGMAFFPYVNPLNHMGSDIAKTQNFGQGGLN